jgi:hypothetical protein
VVFYREVIIVEIRGGSLVSSQTNFALHTYYLLVLRLTTTF